MKKIAIRTSQEKEYTVFIGTKLIDRIDSILALNKYSQVILITGDKTPAAIIKKIQSRIFNSRIITLPTGEKNKTIETVQKIWKKLHDFNCTRKSLLINLGGGIITDIGGFSASTYLKGLDYVNIPTTLLGQVDAGLGGKTSIHFDGAKNLIGLYEPPIAVIDDVSTLSTLPKRDLISGFGEIIKHSLIADKAYFEFVTSKQPHDFTPKELTRIVEKSCEIKSKVRDEKILHFGHTVSHALSARLNHGEAVIIGMIVETKISQLLGLLSKTESDLIISKLRMMHIPEFEGTFATILKTIRDYASHTKGVVRCTLLKGIGHAVTDITVPRDILVQALKQSI